MTAVWTSYHTILLLTLVLLPFATLAVVARYRMLRGGPGAARCALAEVCAGYGTLPWLAMTLTPDPGAPSRINLVPLRDLATLHTTSATVITVQLAGNLLVFAAAGFFLPVRVAALRSLPRMFALGAAGSAVIEITQYAAGLGRVSSVDDVLLNALGAALFALASRHWWHRPDNQVGGAPVARPPDRPDDVATLSG